MGLGIPERVRLLVSLPPLGMVELRVTCIMATIVMILAGELLRLLTFCRPIDVFLRLCTRL